MLERRKTLVVESPEALMRVATRRQFLKVLGVGGTIVLMPSVFAACSDNDTATGVTNPTPQAVTLNMSNDVGILNYAYALEQLEAAFYSAVVASAAFGSFNAEQQETFYDLRNHEVLHREFLRAALGSNAIANLNLNSTVVASTLTSRDVILHNAEMFEDLGVAAYNGAGKYLTDANNLTIAGKIVSVEARHAAAVRDLRESLGVSGGQVAGTRFAGDDVVLPPSSAFQGLDVKLEPSAVLARVASTSIVSDTVSIGTQPPTKAATPDFGPPSPTP